MVCFSFLSRFFFSYDRTLLSIYDRCSKHQEMILPVAVKWYCI